MDLPASVRRHGRGGLRRVMRVGRATAARARRLEQRVTAPLHVLCYHRVAEPFCDPWHLSVSPEAFDYHVRAIAAAGEVVRLEDELADHRRRTLRSLGRRDRHRPRFAVTFDDGYVDNLRVALPVLEAHDVPATVFIPTAFIGAPAFWWDRLAVLVLGPGSDLEHLAGAFTDAGLAIPERPARGWSADALHHAATEAVRDLGPDEIDAVLDQVSAALGVDPTPTGRPMTADELEELANHPLITIGAHSRHHRMLARLGDEAVRAELVDGTTALDQLLGPASRVLAYPHGDAVRRTAAIAHQAGFSHAFTTANRPVSLLDPNRLLPRRHPKDVDGVRFEDWLASG